MGNLQQEIESKRNIPNPRRNNKPRNSLNRKAKIEESNLKIAEELPPQSEKLSVFLQSQHRGSWISVNKNSLNWINRTLSLYGNTYEFNPRDKIEREKQINEMGKQRRKIQFRSGFWLVLLFLWDYKTDSRMGKKG